MKMIKQYPVNGVVTISMEKKWIKGNYGSVNWKGHDVMESEANDLYNSVLRAVKFIDNFDSNDEDPDVPVVSYDEIDLNVEFGYIIEDTEKQKPTSWRQEHTCEHLYEAIEHVIGDIPCRSSYILRREGISNEYHDDFKKVIEDVYRNPNIKVDGMNLEEEEYIDKLKQYLVLVELSK